MCGEVSVGYISNNEDIMKHLALGSMVTAIVEEWQTPFTVGKGGKEYMHYKIRWNAWINWVTKEEGEFYWDTLGKEHIKMPEEWED